MSFLALSWVPQPPLPTEGTWGFLDSSVFPSPDPEPVIPGLDKAPGAHWAAPGLQLDWPAFESQFRSLL